MISMGINRSGYVLKKLSSSALISLVFLVGPVVSACVFSGSLSMFSGKLPWREPITKALASQIIRGIGIAWFCLAFYSGLAVFLAIATKSSQTATTITILMILLEGNLVTSFAERFSFISKIAPYSIGRCTTLIASLIEEAQDILEMLSRYDIMKTFATLGVWFMLFAIFGILIFKRQELGVD